MRYTWPVWLVLCGLMLGCNDGKTEKSPEVLAVRHLPILNGTRVTGRDHLATVALTRYGNDSFCTGTLISPNYVLTAGHCISYCEGDEYNIENVRPYMKVLIGQDENSPLATYEIESFHPHPRFHCSDYYIANDIAVLKLKKSVPLDLVTPIPPMPPEYDMTPSEVDSKAGVAVTTVGFGLTDPDNYYSSGVKYRTDLKVYAYCPTSGSQSRRCGTSSYVYSDGFIYFDSKSTGTCQGDSGGPTFMTRDGQTYVVGVTSFGYEGCASYSAVTLVSEHYSFISGIVTDLAAETPEICDNYRDDNGDGRIDCADPYCYGLLRCIPENCSNDVDDNGDKLVDCNDPQCAGVRICDPENCSNGVDDNGDGNADCNDRQCKDLISCRPEICDNQVDDNMNGLLDCADPQCSSMLVCKPEICNDEVDNNGNNLADCNDPQCETDPACVPEICNNGSDDNGDRLADCADPQCRGLLLCQPEICNDNIDNNGNNLADCADPQCYGFLACQPEICDDKIDNNGNNLVDCAEASCAEHDACQPDKSADGCAATPYRPVGFGAGWLALMAILGGAFIRRRSVR